jgi:hypothetical protein
MILVKFGSTFLEKYQLHIILKKYFPCFTILRNMREICLDILLWMKILPLEWKDGFKKLFYFDISGMNVKHSFAKKSFSYNWLCI